MRARERRRGGEKGEGEVREGGWNLPINGKEKEERWR
jgi:hypothetical protein